MIISLLTQSDFGPVVPKEDESKVESIKIICTKRKSTRLDLYCLGSPRLNWVAFTHCAWVVIILGCCTFASINKDYVSPRNAVSWRPAPKYHLKRCEVARRRKLEGGRSFGAKTALSEAPPPQKDFSVPNKLTQIGFTSKLISYGSVFASLFMYDGGSQLSNILLIAWQRIKVILFE